ncbi:TPA: hypothetical protein DDW35_07155 [Candidatus Sumerlaeota bacterium]|jgi:glycosyltransferase involved in cell wall biosynthesis|nr:hypothetical protein [Candidatus Sumerlaeota bacterium]
MSSSPPRILQLTSSAHIGGTERNILRFLKGHEAGRFDYTLVTMESKGPLLEEARALGVQSIGLPSQSPFNGQTRKRFRDILAEGNFSLAHAYGLRAETLARGMAHNAKVPAYVSGIRSPDPWRKLPHVLLDRFTARGGRVDLFISNSEAGRQSRIEREKFAANKIITIHNGIEPPEPPTAPEFRKSAEASALREKMGIAPDAWPIITVVSNLRPPKGHLDIINAAGILLPNFPKLCLLLAGRDDSNGQIQTAAQNAGLAANARFLGFTSDPYPLMRLSDIYCLPSHWEGCPTALLEAMALECSIVTTHVGGIPELARNEEEALLVPPQDPVQLSSALERLLLDPSLAQKLAHNARQRVLENFTLEQMIRRIEDAYDKLLRRK